MGDQRREDSEVGIALANLVKAMRGTPPARSCPVHDSGRNVSAGCTCVDPNEVLVVLAEAESVLRRRM